MAGEALDRAEVLKAITALERRGGKLTKELVRAYEYARQDLYNQLGNDPSELTAYRLNELMAQVETRLGRLYAEVSTLVGTAMAETIRAEAEQAIKEVRTAPIPSSYPEARRAAISEARVRVSESLRPRIAHSMVEASTRNALDRIKAIDAELRAGIRAELTSGVLQGKSVQKVAKGILGKGLSNDGIKKVFPSVYVRAEVIARTEISRAANMAHVEQYKAAAKDLPGLKARWSSALCSQTCSLCRNQLHNQVREAGKPFYASVGKKVFRGAAPPAHPRCLCRLVAIFT